MPEKFDSPRYRAVAAGELAKALAQSVRRRELEQETTEATNRKGS
jgi:hypothetical protein